MPEPCLEPVLLKKMNLEHLPFGRGAEQQGQQASENDYWWKGLIGNICFKPMDDTCSEFRDSLELEATRILSNLDLAAEFLPTSKMGRILSGVNAIAGQVTDDADVKLARDLAFRAIEIYLRHGYLMPDEEVKTSKNQLLACQHVKPSTSVKLIADRSFHAEPKPRFVTWMTGFETPVFITNFEHPRTDLTGIDACQCEESLRTKLEQLQQDAPNMKPKKSSTNEEKEESKTNWINIYRSGFSPGSTAQEVSLRLNALFSDELSGPNRREMNDVDKTLRSVARTIFNCLHTATGCGALYNHQGLIFFKVRQEIVHKTLSFIEHTKEKTMDDDIENPDGGNVDDGCPYDDWHTETDDELLNGEYEPGQHVVTDVNHFVGYSHKIRKVSQNTVYVSGLMQCDKGLGVILPLIAFIKSLNHESQDKDKTADREQLVDQFDRLLTLFNSFAKCRLEQKQRESSFPLHNLNPGCPFEYVDAIKLKKLVTNSLPVIDDHRNSYAFIGKWGKVKPVVLKVFAVDCETSHTDMENETKMYRYIYRTAGDLLGTILPRIVAMTKHYVGPALHRDVLVTELVGEEIKYDNEDKEYFIERRDCGIEQVIHSTGRMAILKAALKSLSALHARGIVHQSVGLRNMRIEGYPLYKEEMKDGKDIDCKVWWVDLGKAKLIDGDESWREMVNEGFKLARILKVQMEMADDEILGMIMANAKI